MKYLICQINSIVGDLEYNYQKIIQDYRNSIDVDIVIFPELALTGYPLLDLANNQEFIDKTQYYANLIVWETMDRNNAILFGSISSVDNCLFNTAIFAYGGKVSDIIQKNHLPNYGVFNESRNFNSGYNQNIIHYKNRKIGVLICEDMWFDDIAAKYYNQDVSIFIAVNASPYDTKKQDMRYKKASSIAAKYSKTLIYVNLIGAQDELVFDGGSFVIDNNANYLLSPNFWSENRIKFDDENYNSNDEVKSYSGIEHIYQALMLSLRDYMRKNNFETALVGLSGGIDSAMVSVIAADAIGSLNVNCKMLTGPFTTDQSINHAKIIAENINCNFSVIDINNINDVFLNSLEHSFANKIKDVTEENLQARIRGTVLMSISNKFGHMLISTSNKSEFAVGYSTLYGDMCGSFALIYDLYKTEIYELIRWRNDHIPQGSLLKKLNIIPKEIIDKPPSAELNLNQKDSDSLPEYDILDQILHGLIELEISIEELAIKLNISSEFIKQIETKIVKCEFKRRQSAIGPKISVKAFNVERKYPITSRFKI
ncbi:MAG: NAD+ synthase [Rickettsiales bacterium]|nr:MAG: NAD+ synthase [Rickettsiales bacterium]